MIDLAEVDIIKIDQNGNALPWGVNSCVKIVKTHRFNARVTALELGYGIIGRPIMNVLCYLESQHGWLFSGDLYLGERIKFFRSDEKIDQQISGQTLPIVCANKASHDPNDGPVHFNQQGY